MREKLKKAHELIQINHTWLQNAEGPDDAQDAALELVDSIAKFLLMEPPAPEAK